MPGKNLDASAGACLVKKGLVAEYKRQSSRGSGIVSQRN